MLQVPRQNHLLERIVLCIMTGVGLLLIVINFSNMNVKPTIYGVFIIVTSGIRLLALSTTVPVNMWVCFWRAFTFLEM
jgi:hypothetical protein